MPANSGDSASAELLRPVPRPPKPAVRLVIALAVAWVLALVLLATVGREIVTPLQKGVTMLVLTGFLVTGALGLLPKMWGSRNPVTIGIFCSLAGIWLNRYFTTGDNHWLFSFAMFAAMAGGSLLVSFVHWLSTRNNPQGL